MKQLLLIVLILGIGACSGKPKRGVDFGSEIIKASSADAQRLFDEGVQALEEHRWSDAVERFRIVQSQYPDDPIALVAEVYAGRAGLRDLAVLEVGPANVDDAAMVALSQLAQSKVDERVRWAAAAYYAAGLATVGEHAEASSSLATYPSVSLSPLILAGDRPALQVLVAESLLGAGRYGDATGAYGRLWHLAERADLRAFAKSRAFEAAARLDEAELVDSTGGKDDFVRAVCGAALLERRAQRASEDESASLQALMTRIAPDLATIGEANRLEAISLSLAARGPAKRLAIGLVLPLSGAAAQAGRGALDGALVAAGAFDPKAPVTTLVMVDSQTGSPAEHVARLRLAGVSAIVGPLDSRLAGAWAKAANDAEIPIFALTTESLGGAAGQWGFRWFIDARSEATGVARVAVKEQGDARIVILRPNIGYGRRSAEWFATAARAAGATIVLDEEYDRTASDYSRLAARVAKLRPDAIFIPDTATKVGELTAFLAQSNVWGIDGLRRPDARAKRVQVHYLGTSLWNDPALLTQARSYVTGALIPAWSSSAFADAPSRQFFADYSRAVGRPPNDLAAFAADGVGFVRSSFASGHTDALSIRDAAQAKTLYRGVTGASRFGSGGEPVRTLRFISVADGTFSVSTRTATVGLDDET